MSQSNNVRILFLLTQDLESPSGLGRYWPISKELVRLGYQVRVVALHPNFPNLNPKSFSQEGVEVRYVAPMHVRKSEQLKSYYPWYQLVPLMAWSTWRLGRGALEGPDFEILHIGKPHPMNSSAALLANVGKNKPLFLDLDDLEVASTRFQGSWQRTILKRFESGMPRRVTRISTNTFYQQDHLIRSGLSPSRVFYLPNGVDRIRFKDPDPKEISRLRAELGIGQKPVVAFIGSLSLPSHPVDLLVRAFQILLRQIPEAYLLLVGGGEDLPTLRQLSAGSGLSDRVLFTGRIRPNLVPNYYHLAGVTVDPVHDDEAARGRAPLKIFESWAAGTPVVTADVGDRAQILGDPPAGGLAQAGSAESLAREIEKLLSDADLAAEISRRGLERVEEFYWDRIITRLDEAYQEVLRPSKDRLDDLT